MIFRVQPINKRFPTRQSEDRTVLIHMKKNVGITGVTTLESDSKNQSH
jgi:hypothetical protein